MRQRIVRAGRSTIQSIKGEKGKQKGRRRIKRKKKGKGSKVWAKNHKICGVQCKVYLKLDVSADVYRLNLKRKGSATHLIWPFLLPSLQAVPRAKLVVLDAAPSSAAAALV